MPLLRYSNDGENFLRLAFDFMLPTGKRLCLGGPTACTKGNIRIVDAYGATENAAGETVEVLYESKVGRLENWGSFYSERRAQILDQARFDAALAAEPGTNRTVQWHFFPNATGSIETDPELFDLLTDLGIDYFIYLP